MGGELMDHQFCPGSKLLRQPAPEIFTCLSCSGEVEIWTDELKADCPNCHRTLFRDNTMSCLDWCKYGKDCVGDDIYDRHMHNKAVGMKQQLIDRLEEYFGEDRKRIEHAEKVLQFAEQLLAEEKADWHIVIPASILHDVGIKSAEEKYGSSAGNLQETEGPPIAKEILLKMGFNREDIDEICAIIGRHHSPGENESINFKVLYDADCVVNIEKFLEGKSDGELRRIIEQKFLTENAKKLVLKKYVKQTADSHYQEV